MPARQLAFCAAFALSACTTPVPPESSPPAPTVIAIRERPLLTSADTIAAMCAHDPRVGMRLYGCDRPVGPIFIIDGVLMPSDSSPASRRLRDSVNAAQRGREIVEFFVAPPNDSLAMASYGSRAREGIMILRTKPRR